MYSTKQVSLFVLGFTFLLSSFFFIVPQKIGLKRIFFKRSVVRLQHSSTMIPSSADCPSSILAQSGGSLLNNASNPAPLCPALVPDVQQICATNKKFGEKHPPPDNVTNFCSRLDPHFSSLLDVNDEDALLQAAACKNSLFHSPDLAGAGDNYRVLEIFCSTRLRAHFMPRDHTARGIPNAAEPNIVTAMGPQIEEVIYEKSDIEAFPLSSRGGRLLCVPPMHVAVSLSCRKENVWWFLIPDSISSWTLPTWLTSYKMTRYGTPVGWLEFICTMRTKFGAGWFENKVRGNDCYDDSNLWLLPKFSFPSIPESAAADAAIVKEETKSESKTINKKKKSSRWNVVAIQIDSLSRYQAISEMSQFQSFFRQRLFKPSGAAASGTTTKSTSRDWVGFDMLNHNSYMDDTFPNLYAAFAGVRNVRRLCLILLIPFDGFLTHCFSCFI